jgi:hypothetical protein
MKRLFIACLCFLSWSKVGADDVDAFITSYLDSLELRQPFQWSPIHTIDSSEIALRLRQVIDGKRDTVGGHIVTTGTAKRMLVEMGNEDAIREAIADYRQRHFGYTDWIRALVETGQPLGLPYLAVDLTSDEFLIGTYTLPNGDVVIGDPDEKRWFSATFIVELVMHSRSFSEDVRSSARDLFATRTSDHAEFVGVVTNWWLRNRDLIDSGRYRAVSEFQRTGETETVAVASATSPPPVGPLPDAGRPGVLQVAQSYAASRRSQGVALALAVATAVILAVLLLRRRRRSKRGLQ